MEQYQDIIKNGQVIKGVRECETRYQAIKPILERFNRSFSVLDIGANLGYFSFRIAEDFPKSTITMIENLYADQLLNLCIENNKDNIILLKKHLDSTVLKNLSSCEHFDVVLSLSVIHHINDTEETIKNIEDLGDLIIIETPHYLDSGSCGQKNLKQIYDHVEQNYHNMGSFSRHTSSVKSLMGIKNFKKKSLQRRYWDFDKKDNMKDISIESDYDQKYFLHSTKNEKRTWINGINFRTFQYMNGIYPLKHDLIENISKMEEIVHSDLTPWNLILEGKHIHPIDFDDPRHLTITDQKQQIKKLLLKLMRTQYFLLTIINHKDNE